MIGRKKLCSRPAPGSSFSISCSVGRENEQPSDAPIGPWRGTPGIRSVMYAVGLRRKIALLRLPRRHARRRTGEHPLDERHCARQLGPPVGRDAAVQSSIKTRGGPGGGTCGGPTPTRRTCNSRISL